MTGSWQANQDTFYILTVLFGAASLPKATLCGVWKDKKHGLGDEAAKIGCLSPKVEFLIERDTGIVQATSECSTTSCIVESQRIVKRRTHSPSWRGIRSGHLRSYECGEFVLGQRVDRDLSTTFGIEDTGRDIPIREAFSDDMVVDTNLLAVL